MGDKSEANRIIENLHQIAIAIRRKNIRADIAEGTLQSPRPMTQRGVQNVARSPAQEKGCHLTLFGSVDVCKGEANQVRPLGSQRIDIGQEARVGLDRVLEPVQSFNVPLDMGRYQIPDSSVICVDELLVVLAQ